MIDPNHEHNYQFLGIVYSTGSPCSGSSASYRLYEDKYFCTKCLDIQHKNLRSEGTTYSKHMEGTFPK